MYPKGQNQKTISHKRNHDFLYRGIVWLLLLGLFLGTAAMTAFATEQETAAQSTVSTDFAGKDVYGYVTGLKEEDYGKAIILLYDTVNSYASGVGASGEYSFDGIEAGDYYLKIEIEGYQIPSPASVTVETDKGVQHDLSVTAVEDGDYFYQWKADDTFFGYEESANVPEEKTVTFLDEVIYTCDSNAAAKLERNYKIVLSNEELTWSSDYASRMYDLIDSIHEFKADKPSKWILTADEIDDDIEITEGEEGSVIRICKKAFENAIPRKASCNGLKGTYFSNRLYHALIRYATKEGTDIYFIDNLLKHDYGCSIIVEDYEALTASITNETSAAFEQFKAEELLAILEMFAEMPEGLHKVENLEYLVRRIDGAKNPIYPTAAAVSWIYAEHGYIEFMDGAFLASEVEDTFRLVLHEKTHFLWAHVFSEELKAKWIEIGGWYQTPSDTDGWSTSKETEFVTAYSHAVNPDEDMAESVAYYILMPDRLESRSPAKYEFIRDYIMNGEVYMTQIREDLTFEVYNLYPDYAYPGRIVGLDVKVTGAPEEEKVVTVTIELDTHGDSAFGADSAFIRMVSGVNTFYDLWLKPINEEKSILQGTVTFSKYAYKGYWYVDQISLSDAAGNPRFSGVDSFGWKLYINNALADIEPPVYIKDSLYVEMEKGTYEGKPVTFVNIRFKATDNIGISHSYCEIVNNTHDSYRMDNYGTFDNETGEGLITYVFTEYMHSGEWSVNFLAITDWGINYSGYGFYPDGSGAGKPVTFYYESDNSDYEAPEINLNNIVVTAYPTNPENPNGETIVIIDYYARDNASGLGLVNIELLDPLGKTHGDYHYHENFYTTFFEGDPTEWKHYQMVRVLPEGSAPGTWGLLSFRVQDKAGNFRHYNFLEIVHFKVDTEQVVQTYTLTADAESLVAGDEMQISFTTKDDTKEYVWECQNGTGKAEITQDGVLKGITPGYVKVLLYEKEDNTKYGEIEILIISADHSMGEWAVENEATCLRAGLKIRKCTDESCDYFEVMIIPIIPHAKSDWIIVTDATCTTDGSRYTKCISGCSKIFDTETIPAKGHGESEIRDAVAETCGKAGYTGDTYCKDCDVKITTGTVIPATGKHTGGTASCVAKAICTVCGTSYGEVDTTAHGETEIRDAVAETCGKAGYTGDTYCKDCGVKTATGTAIPATGNHTGGTASCVAKAICTVCGTSYGEVDSTAHGETEIRDAVAETCGKAGYTGDTYCKDCDVKITTGTAIPATGNHTGGTASCVDKAVCTVCGTAYGEVDSAAHGETEIRDAVTETCGKSGYTGDTYCKDCDAKITTGTAIPATGKHTGGTASCVDEAICTVCGTAYGEVDSTVHGETEIRDAVTETCGKTGYTGDTYCKDCGVKTATGTANPATGKHTGGTASCVDKAICEVCGTSYGETDSTVHGETEIRDAVTETCGKAGYTGDTYCKDCGVKTVSGTAIPATGKHTGGTATCVDKAICEVCGTAYGEVNPTAHGSTELRNAADPTATTDGYTGDTCCVDCDTVLTPGKTIPALGVDIDLDELANDETVSLKLYKDAAHTQQITDPADIPLGEKIYYTLDAAEGYNVAQIKSTASYMDSECMILDGYDLTFEITSVLAGNFDGNDALNVLDAIWIVRYISGWKDNPDEWIITEDTLAGDYDGNGIVNVLDAIGIVKLQSGLEEPRGGIQTTHSAIVDVDYEKAETITVTNAEEGTTADLITTADELKSYDETLTTKYDGAFFESKDLVIITTSAPTEFVSFKQINGIFTVDLTASNPGEYSTAHIIIISDGMISEDDTVALTGI